MKFTVEKPVEIDIKYIAISVDVRYEDEDMPYDFPSRNNDLWSVKIDIDTGKIENWPGVEYELHMKVCDCGLYWLYDVDGNEVASINGYVPDKIIPGDGDDYIYMQIAKDGTIKNWPKKPKISQFFQNR